MHERSEDSDLKKSSSAAQLDERSRESSPSDRSQPKKDAQRGMLREEATFTEFMLYLREDVDGVLAISPQRFAAALGLELPELPCQQVGTSALSNRQPRLAVGKAHLHDERRSVLEQVPLSTLFRVSVR